MVMEEYLCVWCCSQFEVSEDADSVQMLQRSTQVGEFYRMSPPAVFNEKAKLPATYMDLLIYDEESDRLQHVTFEEALYACCLTATDNLAEIFKVTAADETKSKAHCGVAGATYDVSSVSGIVAMVKAGAWCPVCITIARPFIEHLMVSAVATVAGRDTGATLFGPAGKFFMLHHL